MKRLLVLAFIWGWSFLFIKVAVEGMTPPTVACARVALGALTLHLVLRGRAERLPRDRRTWWHFTVVALFGSALPFTMLAWGEERITSALTAVLNASTPLFTALAAVVYLKERIRVPQVVGLVIGLAGVAIAAGVGTADLAGSSMAGAAAAVIAGAFYGFAFTWMRRHLTVVPPIVAAAGQLTMATALLLPFAVATSVREGIQLQPNRVLSIVLLGVVGTGIAYVLNYRVVAELGATRASLVTYIIPIVAVTVGVVVLGEQFESRILVGGAVTAAGIALVNNRARLPSPDKLHAAAVVLILLLLPLSGCGDSAASTGACSAPKTEPLDSNLSHILPGAPDPTYLTDPPTSGPHQPSQATTGVSADPLPRPIQVGLLEGGKVLLQYGDLDPAAQTELESLASDDVVVAPNADLPAPVVATAWLTKVTCTSIDVDALDAFIAAHKGKGPGGHG